MIDGMFVLDSVVHAFNSTAENALSRYGRSIFIGGHKFQSGMVSGDYRLEPLRYFQPMTADIIEATLFAESQVDFAVYHTIPIWGFIKDWSPASIGAELCRRHPNRMRMYGGVSPLQGKRALDEIDRQVEEYGIIGMKIYPMDIVDGEVRALRFNDQEVMYPVLERCRKLGVKVVAVHKAFPLGPVQMDPFRNGDVDYAAVDFPDLAFEVVHSGMAFLDEAAAQVGRFDNIYVNLESTAALAENFPRKFATILGEFLAAGAQKRIFWSSGSTNPHPRPVLEAFAKMEMPADLMEGYGYPALTPEIKADLLGLNYARLHGLDIDAIKTATADDAVSRQRAGGLAPPWSKLPVPAQPDRIAIEAMAS